MKAIVRFVVRPILAIVFLVVFLPLNLLSRARGRDPMGLRYDPMLPTYRRTCGRSKAIPNGFSQLTIEDKQ
ncbi:hypothetical protein [Sorangium sp. So ce131]|uniref:hypothetical protein n=1 Tax=Sorangium sp. So ce131 TaxID=3133282 RepID=UPI003F6463E8